MNGFRIYHALFAAGVAIAWFTAESLGLIHAWTGYVVAALLALRAVMALAHVRGFELARIKPRFGPAPRGQGGLRHPAIGRLLTLGLLLAVATTAGTGIAMDRGGTLIGQSVRATGGQESPEPSLAARRDGDAGEEDEGAEEHEEHGLLGEIHETSGNLLLPLALLHIVWLLLFRFDLARFVLFVPRRRPA